MFLQGDSRGKSILLPGKRIKLYINGNKCDLYNMGNSDVHAPSGICLKVWRKNIEMHSF